MAVQGQTGFRQSIADGSDNDGSRFTGGADGNPREAATELDRLRSAEPGGAADGNLRPAGNGLAALALSVTQGNVDAGNIPAVCQHFAV